ncbi:hypothetical protein V1J52_09880 [Streptomyces sp. TRM 70351]|uniref:hypothetical protein n=1 Tax=Streptomyces sp. TRM 70351 TaxID=3116552 RepID=UPI002E7B5F3B|nr:hypothetical protein [Streptomyces sp. TRM 70351]MEE1928497.1 hypothetical protein [Streptomyces sp. TRM 70351]
MSVDFSSVIAATARWLTRAYPPPGGAMSAALAEAQARQAATVAAWLRYPTEVDAALAAMAGCGGSARLDRVVGAGARDAAEYAWRTWVDEVVASWAACLLASPELARAAVEALAGSEHAGVTPREFRRLTAPDEHDRQAAPLLRHPDLVGPVAELHRAPLLARLQADPVPG